MLVAISIPIFTSQLDKAKLATDTANARNAVAKVVTAAMTADPAEEVTDSMINTAVSGAMTQGCSAKAEGGIVTVKSPRGKTNTFPYDTDSVEAS